MAWIKTRIIANAVSATIGHQHESKWDLGTPHFWYPAFCGFHREIVFRNVQGTPHIFTHLHTGSSWWCSAVFFLDSCKCRVDLIWEFSLRVGQWFIRGSSLAHWRRSIWSFESLESLAYLVSLTRLAKSTIQLGTSGTGESCQIIFNCSTVGGENLKGVNLITLVLLVISRSC